MGKINELELISKVKENKCDQSYLKLKEAYGAIFTKVLSYYQPRLYACGLDWTEMASELDGVLFKAIVSFKAEKKVMFSTYFWNSCKFFFLKLITKHNRKPLVVVENEVLFDILSAKVDERAGITKTEFTIDYFRGLIEQFDDARMKKVFSARYLEDRASSWDAVAKKVNISKELARKLDAKGRKILLSKINFEKVLA